MKKVSQRIWQLVPAAKQLLEYLLEMVEEICCGLEEVLEGRERKDFNVIIDKKYRHWKKAKPWR